MSSIVMAFERVSPSFHQKAVVFQSETERNAVSDTGDISRRIRVRTKVICISGTSSSKPFQVLATDQVHSLDFT